jgi:hypothetical protein
MMMAEALGVVIVHTFFLEATVSAALSDTATHDAPRLPIKKVTATWTDDEDIVASERQMCSLRLVNVMLLLFPVADGRLEIVQAVQL